jgi:hypothetical protein
MGNNAYKQKHREQGLCVDCSRPVLPGQTKCIIHNEKSRARTYRHYQKNHDKVLESNRKIKQRYRDANRCPSCGAPLGEQDEDCSHCVNCRDGSFQAILGHSPVSGELLETYYKKIAS